MEYARDLSGFWLRVAVRAPEHVPALAGTQPQGLSFRARGVDYEAEVSHKDFAARDHAREYALLDTYFKRIGGNDVTQLTAQSRMANNGRWRVAGQLQGDNGMLRVTVSYPPSRAHYRNPGPRSAAAPVRTVTLRLKGRSEVVAVGDFEVK